LCLTSGSYCIFPIMRFRSKVGFWISFICVRFSIQLTNSVSSALTENIRSLKVSNIFVIFNLRIGQECLPTHRIVLLLHPVYVIMYILVMYCICCFVHCIMINVIECFTVIFQYHVQCLFIIIVLSIYLCLNDTEIKEKNNESLWSVWLFHFLFIFVYMW